MVPVFLLFMANTEDPFSATSYSVAMALLTTAHCIAAHQAPPLPLEGSVTIQGLY